MHIYHGFFTYDPNHFRGSDLPPWLHFDDKTLQVRGTPPSEQATKRWGGGWTPKAKVNLRNLWLWNVCFICAPLLYSWGEWYIYIYISIYCWYSVWVLVYILFVDRGRTNDLAMGITRKWDPYFLFLRELLPQCCEELSGIGWLAYVKRNNFSNRPRKTIPAEEILWSQRCVDS